MEAWIERVLDEQRELAKKTEALTKFLNSDSFKLVDEFQQRLLQQQCMVMEHYNLILRQRLEAILGKDHELLQEAQASEDRKHDCAGCDSCLFDRRCS